MKGPYVLDLYGRSLARAHGAALACRARVAQSAIAPHAIETNSWAMRNMASAWTLSQLVQSSWRVQKEEGSHDRTRHRHSRRSRTISRGGYCGGHEMTCPALIFCGREAEIEERGCTRKMTDFIEGLERLTVNLPRTRANYCENSGRWREERQC